MKENFETWKHIKGFHRYLVSDRGRIMLLNPRHRPHPKIASLALDSCGYYRVGLSDDNKVKRTVKVHRITAMAYISNPLNLPEVNHKDLNKTNNAVSNLEWCTHKENMAHAATAGVFANGFNKPVNGVSVGNYKLKEDQVRTILKMYNSGEYSYPKLSEMFNISISHVGRIVQKKVWKHVQIID